MDWLSENQAEIVCSEKVIWIPQDGNDLIEIQGDKSDRKIKLVSCIKMQKYLRKEYVVFLVHVVDRKGKEEDIGEVPIVREFSDVFPKDLLGLPPQREVEFGIDLIPGAAPVAKAPYRLTPAEMQKMPKQLQEFERVSLCCEWFRLHNERISDRRVERFKIERYPKEGGSRYESSDY
ncbi:uncharacterized protein LOC112504666 [Cynara cardunculus var. scolymus]|uniref:uncharacterized protein LOC112504666 n=1 Tax=Cynara cardunculus var. scolymus TaxID=59895 RepID=UPI000D62E200|nr:uncharacterized protein LOC112504666 [Cynara cardunculus var. scolymus]